MKFLPFAMLLALALMSCVQEELNPECSPFGHHFSFKGNTWLSPDNYDYMNWGNPQGTPTYCTKSGNRVTCSSWDLDFCGSDVRICSNGITLVDGVEQRGCWTISANVGSSSFSFNAPSMANYSVEVSKPN